ncbi:hypothetical protein B0H13DRAFT_2451819 [Mycena leptocephala]|nr:hypothetical protein B0H13DRAFT_2451819 [Mycena leptocephala]
MPHPPPLPAFTRTVWPASAPASPSVGNRLAQPAARTSAVRKGVTTTSAPTTFLLFRRKCCEDRALSLSSSPASSASVSAPSSMASGPSSVDSPSLAVNAQGRSSARPTARTGRRSRRRSLRLCRPLFRQRPLLAIDDDDQHGRSASAPTPPPPLYQAIPNVYMPASASGSFSFEGGEDSPTSLMPMIARRGVGNGAGGLDYMPNFAGAFDFEASLQSSDFLRAMFPPTISPTSPPSGGAGIMSPASSTSGSGPSSPYIHASASFHASAFTTTFSSGSALLDNVSYPSSTLESGLGLGLRDAAMAGIDPRVLRLLPPRTVAPQASQMATSTSGAYPRSGGSLGARPCLAARQNGPTSKIYVQTTYSRGRWCRSGRPPSKASAPFITYSPPYVGLQLRLMRDLLALYYTLYIYTLCLYGV